MLVFEMQHSIDHYNACAKHVLVRRGVLEHDGLRSPADALGDASRMLLERHLAGLAAHDGRCRCRLTARARPRRGLREPQRLSQQLSTLLAAEIVSGRIGVGEAFPSSEEIVNRFGVSRTVARETVQALAMLGMVNIQHGKRTEVCPPEDWDILSATVQEALRREGKAEPLLHDLYEFRLLIEPQAAAWMAEHGTTEELAELGELVDRMESLVDADASVDEVMEADRSFHDLVARASENRVLAAVSRDIREVIGDALGLLEPRCRATPSRSPSSTGGSPTRCCGARRRAAAAAAMRDHLLLGRAGRPARARRAGRAPLPDGDGGGVGSGPRRRHRHGRDVHRHGRASTPRPAQVDSLKTSSTPAHAGAGDRQRARRGRRRRGRASRRSRTARPSARTR